MLHLLRDRRDPMPKDSQLAGLDVKCKKYDVLFVVQLTAFHP